LATYWNLFVKIGQFTLFVCIDRLTFPSKKQGKFNDIVTNISYSKCCNFVSLEGMASCHPEQVLLHNQVVFTCTKNAYTHTHWGREILECTHCLLLFFSGLKSGKFGSSFSLQNPLWRLKDTITIRNLLVGKACNNHKCFFFPWQIN